MAAHTESTTTRPTPTRIDYPPPSYQPTQMKLKACAIGWFAQDGEKYDDRWVFTAWRNWLYEFKPFEITGPNDPDVIALGIPAGDCNLAAWREDCNHGTAKVTEGNGLGRNAAVTLEVKAFSLGWFARAMRISAEVKDDLAIRTWLSTHKPFGLTGDMRHSYFNFSYRHPDLERLDTERLLKDEASSIHGDVQTTHQSYEEILKVRTRRNPRYVCYSEAQAPHLHRYYLLECARFQPVQILQAPASVATEAQPSENPPETAPIKASPPKQVGCCDWFWDLFSWLFSWCW